MLLSSMDHLNYYAMPKDGYLEVDTGAPLHPHAHLGAHLQAPPPPPPHALGLSLGGGYALPGEDLSSAYQNEENSPKNGTKSSLYKTELCKRFSEFGNCRYGAKCQFAHGIAELRHVVRHPKYKTTKCKSYWGSGHCPYGSRCRFIHEEAEAFSQPQFSPPAGMSGSGALGGAMFKDPPSFGSLMMPPSAGNGNNGLAAGSSSAGDLALPGYGLYGPSSYAKDYSLFDKSATWAPAPARGSPHGASTLSGSFSSSSVPPPPPPAAVPSVVSPSAVNASAAAASSAAAAPGSSTYPDLQDAIDALMKFSLSPADEAVAGVAAPAASAGLKSPTLADAKLAKATGTDFALESDELWKDFPAAAELPDTLREPQHWSAGLSLSLDASPFDVAASPASTDKPVAEKPAAGSGSASGTASGSSSNSEESPRLSVFERFH